MGTRRWFSGLAAWIQKNKLTREDVARRSRHDVGYVLALFEHPEPNPTLRLFLSLLESAGARLDTAGANTTRHVVSRINELRARAGLTVAALAKRAGMQRSHLSRIINDDDPNMQLVVFSSLITALGAENEMQIVARFHNAQAAPLALAVGAEPMGAAPGRRLHVVSPDAPAANGGGRQTTAGGPAGPRADRTTQQIEQERARASRAEAEAARAKQRADEAEARAREDYERAEMAAYQAALEKERADAAEARLETLRILGKTTLWTATVGGLLFGGAYAYDRYVKTRS